MYKGPAGLSSIRSSIVKGQSAESWQLIATILYLSWIFFNQQRDSNQWFIQTMSWEQARSDNCLAIDASIGLEVFS